MHASVTAPDLTRRRKWWVTLVGLALALGVASLPIGDWDHEFAGVGHLVGNEAIWWIYVAAMLWYVRNVEHRPLSSIGFRTPSIGNIAIGLCAGLLITAVLGAMYFIVLPALHLSDSVASSANAGALMATPFWWRFISTLRAAVAEEVLFRGYAIERMEELSGSRTAAVVVSCAIFTFAHVSSWGWSHELFVAVGGLAFSLLYLWRRNLWVNILAHFIVDAVSVLA
jgi:uncharacterized protein